MQNAVPGAMSDRLPIEADIAARALANRRDAYVVEVRRLIDAAFSVMSETGEIDPPVRDIIKHAGLSNQAFYRHFQGKDEFLLAILDDGLRQLLIYLEHETVPMP